MVTDPDFVIKIEEIAGNFEVKKLTSTSKILLDSKSIREESIQKNDLIALVVKIENILKIETDLKNALGNDDIRIHKGGKQALNVFESTVNGKKYAIKVYRPIISHLLIHTFATNFLGSKTELNQILEKYHFPGKLKFPKTYAIKLSEESNPRAILVQDWVDETNSIYELYPTTHVQILNELVKAINKYKIIKYITS